MDLLPKHRHLLQKDIGELGGSIAGRQVNWVALVESALAAADHVNAGLPMVNFQAAYVTQPRCRRTHSLLHEDRAASALDTLET